VNGLDLRFDFGLPVQVDKYHVLIQLSQSVFADCFLCSNPAPELSWFNLIKDAACKNLIIKDDFPFVLVSSSMLTVIVEC